MSSREELIAEVVVDNAKKMKRDPKFRNKTAVISGLLFIACIVVLNSGIISANYALLKLIPIALLILSGLALLSVFTSFLVRDSQITAERLKELDDEKKFLLEKTQNESNIIDFVRLNLNQLDEYYTINKIQSRNSFRLSVLTIVLGTSAIIFSIFYTLYNNEYSNITIITAVAGALMEFIGATSIMLYKESMKSISSFYIRLTQLQNIMLAIELSNALKDDKKDRETSKIISTLIGGSDNNL